MEKKKVLFVATVVKTHINVFHIPYLKMLKEMGYETHVAARNDFENPKDCIIPYCDVYHDLPFERNPAKKANIVVYKKLKKLMLKENFDIVHCHTPVGSTLTRLVYKNIKLRVKTKCIYTAHGFHFYKGAPILNWLIYYPIEKYLSKYTDVLITINKEDYKCAKTHFKMKKLEYVPGVGIDLDSINSIKVDSKNIRESLSIPKQNYFLLSVGELIPRKNHSFVIKALSGVYNVTYVICGRGILKKELQELALKHNVDLRLLGFRDDKIELMKSCDLFVFPSLQEGLPVALMEALASGCSCLVSDIRGSSDLINKSEYLFSKNNILEFKEKMMKILRSNNQCSIDMDNYDIKNVNNKVKEIYEKISNK